MQNKTLVTAEAGMSYAQNIILDPGLTLLTLNFYV